MRDHPRWSNAIITTARPSIAHSAQPARDAMGLASPAQRKADKLMFERHTIATAGLRFVELKQRALIDSAAQAANDAHDFSAASAKIDRDFEQSPPHGAPRRRQRQRHLRPMHRLRPPRNCSSCSCALSVSQFSAINRLGMPFAPALPI
jgi:hypothetical protein